MKKLSGILKLAIFAAATAYLFACEQPTTPDPSVEEEIAHEGRDEQSPLAESVHPFPKSVLFNKGTMYDDHKDLTFDEIIEKFSSTRRSYSAIEGTVAEWDPIAPEGQDRYNVIWFDLFNDEKHNFEKTSKEFELNDLEPGAYVFAVRQERRDGDWTGYNTSLDYSASPPNGWYVVFKPNEIDSVVSEYLSYPEDNIRDDRDHIKNRAFVEKEDLEDFIEDEWKEGNVTNAELSMVVDFYKNR